ncbi:peptidoglycan-binding domain-containing protein [Klebsiella sp. I138]|uniref:peptidoglycan-binding domain-containing protein n=1 Tax=Klebsiella sp. I138 TaxID=2755385 RepID=UPI003DA97427
MQATQYSNAVKNELNFPGPLQAGSKGLGARRVQEWLSHHNVGTKIDGDYGPATTSCVSQFQTNNHLPQTGIVDEATWSRLVAPLTLALTDSQGASLGERILNVAQQHLANHPREYGGDNRGPWVRVYTGGYDGPEWLWCAGFVSFILKQAATELGLSLPITGSLSCDVLASQAQSAGRLVKGSDLQAGKSSWASLGQTYIFLVRREAGDYSHTGMGFGGTFDVFKTIEGNTNDDGSKNGYEVAARTRSADSKDFIRIL